MKIDFSKLPSKAPEYDLQVLFDANMHYGHQASAWHPRMKAWIHSEKNGVHIFDLEKTAKQLQTAYNLFFQLGAEDKQVILVGTKRQAREIIAQVANQSGLNYMTSRWLGGFLTNWEQVYKSLKKMLSTEDQLQQGAFSHRTKYEVVQIEKEQNRLHRFFDGVKGLKSRPDAIFVVDPKKEKNVVKEANLEGIPVVGLVDSNTNPQQIDLVIPGNDDAIKSIELVVSELGKAYAEGKKAPKKSADSTEIKKSAEIKK